MKLEEYLDGMASLYGKALNPTGAKIFISALSGYSENQIMAALDKCTRELRQFPTIADVISRIDDGRPGVEEAWAICPKTEAQSAVWTEEISSAFFSAALPLMDQDPIAARMAFKEKYTQLLANARNNKSPVRWAASLGHDKANVERTLRAAIESKRISVNEARELLPSTAFHGIGLELNALTDQATSELKQIESKS